ncbi:hypothetical protein LCGC14_1326900 [marine sediment metagenome]|uniref:Uncharacterized protein n=1 Tax=marine sediment metagenome TaxID=412755 RepID=A0A0F9NK68_9ZZZZ
MTTKNWMSRHNHVFQKIRGKWSLYRSFNTSEEATSYAYLKNLIN